MNLRDEAQTPSLLLLEHGETEPSELWRASALSPRSLASPGSLRAPHLGVLGLGTLRGAAPPGLLLPMLLFSLLVGQWQGTKLVGLSRLQRINVVRCTLRDY